MTDIARPVALAVEPLIVPDSLDAADAPLFLEMVRIANAVCLYEAGHDYLREEPEEALGFWQDQTDWTQLGFAVRRDDAVLGVVKIMIGTESDVTAIEFDLMVDPPFWGLGVEELLLAEVEREARERGLATIQTWTLHRPGRDGARLEPSTGWGSIPAEDRQTIFPLAHGFTLEQVERNSVFDLTGDFADVERMHAAAVEAAGPEYRSIAWTSPTPSEYADGFAEALARMSTDAPQGGLVVDEQHWDAARVARRDARQQAQGLTVSVAAVVHEPTGAIAAYNELVIAEDHRGATQQYGTLVLKEHRGRRLGTVVKCANLLRWRELVPESPRVSTFNAEENRHMLDINEAIGFVPASYAGAWKKVLDL
ncbi:GNAT family N-acetyltransferase [Microbacterium allomyrinae]|jgi:GNAT superfamily N-acetyltransferase|uniref:GNAT family N-acetyltransferase n=1 Tax=Microbacterium allomyrinae TaxID=2830666 RepID=A0A9X1LV42_9MICO|nr:GNAT family N-acetyltransferase [Microbacterium allomyrinae]MCC2032387.1 GNAT family N-acetyltransferase [Microbacterium allomyrinae]